MKRHAHRSLPTQVRRVGSIAGAGLLMVGQGSAEVSPVTLSWTEKYYGDGDVARLQVCGEPGLIVFLAMDVEPGPAAFPIVGTIDLGVTSEFRTRGAGPIPASGKLTFDCNIVCSLGTFGRPIYVQALSIDPETGVLCLSDLSATLFVDTNDSCDLGDEGCSAALWARDGSFVLWPSPYTPDTPFTEVFDENVFVGVPLGVVLETPGNGLSGLGREAVAALLNAQSPSVRYDLTPEQVIRLFELVVPCTTDDYNDLRLIFLRYNLQGCTLRSKRRRHWGKASHLGADSRY